MNGVPWLALAALLTPWATLVPFNAIDTRTAIAVSPTILWNAGALLAVSAIVARSDWRLGLVVAYISLNALRTPFMARPWTIATTVALAALAFVLLRDHPPTWMKWPLIVSGLAQVALGAVQWWWFDPFWHQGRSDSMVLGTIGQQTLFGAYLAIIGSIAPWWAVPIFVGGVVLSGSRLAWVALGVALVVRVWPRAEAEW